MRIPGITVRAAGAVVTAAGLVLTPLAATAVAGDREDNVKVTPSTIAAGGEIDLRVDNCGDGREAVGVSDAFERDAWFEPAADGGLFAQARIRGDAEPRQYEIKVDCKDSDGKSKGTVTVIAHRQPSPMAPVRAGGGGTAELAAAEGAESEGPGARHAVIGAVLVGVAGLAFAGRRLRRGRRTG